MTEDVELDHEGVPLQSVEGLENGAKIVPPRKDEPNGKESRGCRKWWRKLSNCSQVSLIVLLTTIACLIAAAAAYYFFIAPRFFSQENHIQPNGLKPPNPEVPMPSSPSVLHVFKNAAVCSDSDICSEIGRNILQRNGNIVDAAIAAMFCSGLTLMQSMGIGGGFIMNIYKANEKSSYTLDARDVAPEAATPEIYQKDPKATNAGPLAIGVPGEIRGYWAAHKRFGAMNWSDLVAPTLQLCETGFIASKHMVDSLQMNSRVRHDKNLRQTFIVNGTGQFIREGTHIKPPKNLCATLRLVQQNGGDDFYNGTLATAIVADLEQMGSLIKKKDLRKYRVKWRNSTVVDLGKYSVHVPPPPAGGVLVAFILNILKGYNFTSDDVSTENKTALTNHRISEAFKYAFAQRSRLGDPDFNDLTPLLENLTSPEYAESIRQQIDDMKTVNDLDYYGARFYSIQNDNGTAHFSFVAPNGDALAVTSTINYYFGCGLTGTRTGIIFNTGIDDFSIPGLINYNEWPGASENSIQPHKRAISSMAPTIVTDNESGTVRLVLGAAGGTKIITAIALTITRFLWLGDDVKQSVDRPRFHNQLFPLELQYEFGTMQQVVAGLETRGHKMKRYKGRGSVVCAISKNETAIYANADFRKRGDVFGF